MNNVVMNTGGAHVLSIQPSALDVRRVSLAAAVITTKIDVLLVFKYRFRQ
jgi:hypothetical protein